MNQQVNISCSQRLPYAKGKSPTKYASLKFRRAQKHEINTGAPQGEFELDASADCGKVYASWCCTVVAMLLTFLATQNDGSS